MSDPALLIYLKHIGLLIATLLMFTVVGILILGRKKEITYQRLFFSLLTGTLIFSTLYALVKTQLASIHLLYVLLALWFWVEKRFFRSENAPSIPASSPPVGHLITSTLSGVAVIFSWAFLQRIRSGAFPYALSASTHQAGNDFIINSFRSHFLGATGQENYYHIINTFDPGYHGAKPYHYLEMWLNAGITDLWGGLNVVNMTLITFPLLYFISFLGILALWENRPSPSWWSIPFSLLFLFIGGFHIELYNTWDYPAFNLPLMSYRVKMAPYYIFLLASLLQFRKGNVPYALLWLLGLVIATVVVAPGLSGGIMLFLLLAPILRLITWQTTFRLSGYVFSVLICFVLFYYLFDTGGPSIRKGANLGELGAILSAKTGIIALLAAKLPVFIQSFLHTGLLFLPYAGLALVFRRELRGGSGQQRGGLALLLMGILLSAALAYAFFHPQKDATQLYYNLAIPLLNCAVILLCIKVLQSRLEELRLFSFKGGLTFCLVGLLVFFSYRQAKVVYGKTIANRNKNHFSQAYLLDIQSYIQGDAAATLGAAIKGRDDYRSPFSKQTAAYSLGYYLGYMKNGCVAVSISDLNIPTSHASEERDVASGSFYQFVQRQQADNSFISVENSQIDFIREQGISFVIASGPANVSDTLMSMVKEVYRDSRSKERFLVLE